MDAWLTAGNSALWTGSTLFLCRAKHVGMTPLNTYMIITDKHGNSHCDHNHKFMLTLNVVAEMFDSLFRRSCLRQFQPGPKGVKPPDWLPKMPLCQCFNSNRFPTIVPSVQPLANFNRVIAVDQWHWTRHYGWLLHHCIHAHCTHVYCILTADNDLRSFYRGNGCTSRNSGATRD